MLSVISLTRYLVSLNSVNPSGNEAVLAKYIGELLAENGFATEYISYGENRKHLIAKKNCTQGKLPIVFSGHLDTVPLGEDVWSVNPFLGEIKEGKIYGRGTSDMKGGVAAIIVAAIEATKKDSDAAVCLIFTADEETGCHGAKHLVESYSDLVTPRGIIIAEPTANIPAIGHKGGLYLKVTAKGKTAHSSMPHLGVNAIYKVVEGVLKSKNFEFNEEEDLLLGLPTLNVGTIRGGLNLNSVPDQAEFTIDIRTTTNTDHTKLILDLEKQFGSELSIEVLVNLTAISTNEKNIFTKLVYSSTEASSEMRGVSMPYLTDGSILKPAFKEAPTIILGPGEPEMAHKIDEFCYVDKLERAVEIYSEIILKGSKLK